MGWLVGRLGGTLNWPFFWQIGGTWQGVEGAKANGDVELSAGAAGHVGQMRTAQETSTPGMVGPTGTL